MKSPTILLRSLLDDFGRLHCAKGTDRDSLTISLRFENEGYGFLSITLPNLMAAIERGLSTGRFACPIGLKKIKGGAIPKLFSGMLCDVFDSATGELKQGDLENQIQALKSLRMILLMFKKIPTLPDQTKDLERKAKEAFVANDRLVLENFPEDKAEYLRRVAQVVLPDLNSRDLQELEPRHGPGSVYDGETPNQKWYSVSDGITQDAIWQEGYGFATFSFTVAGLPSLEGPDTEKDENHPSLTVRSHALRGVSRLVCVPKSVTALRPITVEPCRNQFIQQGLNRMLRDSISNCPVLSNSLALTDQSKNQILALEGSRTGAYSTLDLKSASDLLSNKLVHLVFQKHPDFLGAMEDCRTPSCEIDDRQFTLRKFAGMGNALTFPVQSVVFALLAIAADCYRKGLRPTRKNVIASSHRVRVYGDDIIVHEDATHDTIAWLEDFGLEVNTSKSFYTGWFRESCGVDAYKGVDITPIYLRVRPDDTRWTASSIASLVAFCNQAWMQGYYGLAIELGNSIEDFLGRKLPLVRTEFGGLGWTNRQNAYDYTRWSPTLQRPEIKAFVIKSRKRLDNLDGYPALLKFFLTPLIEREKDHLRKSVKRYNSSISTRWLPA